jgi:hypothetical protein
LMKSQTVLQMRHVATQTSSVKGVTGQVS